MIVMRTGSFTRTASPTSSPTPRTPSPPSNAPTPEYRQHHNVEAPRIDGQAFQPAWRIRTRVAVLAERGAIGRSELEAASRWQRWVEVVSRVAVQSWERPVDCSHRPDDGVGDPKLLAADNLKAAATALGQQRSYLLMWSVVGDEAWSQIARRLGVSDKTVVLRVIEALAALASYLSHRPVPAPPRTRPYHRANGRQ